RNNQPITSLAILGFRDFGIQGFKVNRKSLNQEISNSMIRPRQILLKIAFIWVFLLSLVPEISAQNKFLEPSEVYNPGRLRGVVITEIAGGLLISAGLYYLWYRK